MSDVLCFKNSSGLILQNLTGFSRKKIYILYLVQNHILFQKKVSFFKIIYNQHYIKAGGSILLKLPKNRKNQNSCKKAKKKL